MARGPHRRRRRTLIARAIASVLAVGVLIAIGSGGAYAAGLDEQDATVTARAHAATHGGVSAIGSRTAARDAVDTSVDDFSFSSFDADYTIGRDPDGHSTLQTTETLVAQFPQTDQNHGIRRAIPTHIDGHPTDVKIISVKDGSGKARSYSTDSDDDDDGDFLVVTIAADGFVHGAQTYVIRYSQRNVIHYPDDANDEEFYWDINGTGWAQKFDTVSGTLRVPAPLVPKLTGQSACFQGPQGSSSACDELSDEALGGGHVFTASGADIAAHANVTMVVGFRQGTFIPRDSSFFASPVAIPLIASAALAVIAAIVAGIARGTRWASARGRPTIIAEYQPPADVDVLLASRLITAAKKAPVAAILDLAVRNIVRVIEVENSDSGDGKKPKFELELVRTEGLSSPDRALIVAVFGSIRSPGARQNLTKPSPPMAQPLAKLIGKLGARSRSSGYERSTTGRLKTGIVALAIAATVLSIVFSVMMLADELGGLWPFLALAVGIVLGIAALVVVGSAHPLTAQGAEARDHLAGLRLYIELAEADRMRVLQSPEGALRSTISHATPDTAMPAPLTDEQVLRLNEKLLPYAVLFGKDDAWSRVLGEAYDRVGSSPDWYYGNTAFNAIIFATAISRFSSMPSTWTGSGSSSSGSGFGGGGFSGGGGGGGGGGGV